jgi:hypothetical protein
MFISKTETWQGSHLDACCGQEPKQRLVQDEYEFPKEAGLEGLLLRKSFLLEK